MTYLIGFAIGFPIGALITWLLLMAMVVRWKDRERSAAEQTAAAGEASKRAADRLAELAREASALRQRKDDFDRRVVTFREIEAENQLLKRDLRNIDVMSRKLEIDGQTRERQAAEISARGDALARRYLADTVKAVVSAVGPSNFTACKQRLIDAITRCRDIGYMIPLQDESALLADLRVEFERAVRASFEREEQARIKAQIREEEKLKREIDREVKQIERERLAVQAALDIAMAKAQGQHTAEVDLLKQRLAEAEEKSKRAMSMAQQTKSGHVYVISNIGTFGADIYKVGMTRRLKPEERINELGSASVPFPFDVHMMIRTNNVPGLENVLHRALHKRRVNRANPRKEFFHVTLDDIRRIVEAEHGVVEFVADAEALEYRQSISMSDEDAAYVERVYDLADEVADVEFSEES